MSVGDPFTIEKMDENGDWSPYFKGHLLQTNKTKSSEYVEAAGEQSTASVTFRLRWHKKLEPIEYDMPSYRLKWHGHAFDVRGYDDYMYQHRTVNIRGVSYG
jgi:head-tail adaptor